MTRPLLKKITRWEGAGCLIAGVSIYLYVLFGPPHLTPVTLPVSLLPGTIRTPEFAADLSEEYLMFLTFDRSRSVEKLGCFLGFPDLEPGGCAGASNLIDISWRVTEGRTVLQEGSSGQETAIQWSSPIYLLIGRFRATSGHRYDVTLEVKKDASQLQAHPKLLITVPENVREDYQLRSSLQSAAASLLTAAGLVVLLAPLYMRRLARILAILDRALL